jgi:hypothetical protein
VRELGVGSVRIDFVWAERQSEPGGPIDFSDLDAQLVRAADTAVFVTISQSPEWAAACRVCPPAPDAWRAFVRTLFERYRDRRHVVFGLWNEPNGDQFFKDDEQATHYIALAKIALKVRDEEAPDVRLAVPETAYHAALPRQYYASVIKEIGGLLRPHDVITVHWYRAPDAPPIVPYMRYIAQRAPGHEVWLTEANGESTCDDVKQTRDLQHVLYAMDSQQVPQWTRTYVYVLHDGIPCGMGLLQPDWSRRAAFDWFRTYIAARTHTE